MAPTFSVLAGDAFDRLPELPDNSVDSIVTDPPYGLEFQGKEFDAPWKSWGSGGTTDAGFASHGYGDSSHRLPAPSFTSSTNPKCLECGGTKRGRRDGSAKVAVCLCPGGGRFPNVRGAEMQAFGRWCNAWAVECLRVLKPGGYLVAFGGTRTWHRLAVGVEDAGFEIKDSLAWLYGSGMPKSHNVSAAFARRADQERSEQYAGYGTQLKPSHEPAIIAQKPGLSTISETLAVYGTGALNIDAGRLGTAGGSQTPSGMDRYNAKLARTGYRPHDYAKGVPSIPPVKGRWPGNVILDEWSAAEIDAQSGKTRSRRGKARQSAQTGQDWGMRHTGTEYDDEGGASRFFFCAKAPTKERPVVNGVAHVTVKPLSLMRQIVRIFTPVGGTVLDPFAGSGTTLEAGLLEGLTVVGIERDPDYLPLINARIARCIAGDSPTS